MDLAVEGHVGRSQTRMGLCLSRMAENAISRSMEDAHSSALALDATSKQFNPSFLPLQVHVATGSTLCSRGPRCANGQIGPMRWLFDIESLEGGYCRHTVSRLNTRSGQMLYETRFRQPSGNLRGRVFDLRGR
jgi:hypothetical protein